MKRIGRGSIINIVGARNARNGFPPAKGAVHLLTRAAAVMLAGVRVNSITPESPRPTWATRSARRLKARVAAYPMGRAGQPIEVSQGVLFLACDESSFVTGADYRIDGGALAGVKHRQ